MLRRRGRVGRRTKRIACTSPSATPASASRRRNRARSSRPSRRPTARPRATTAAPGSGWPSLAARAADGRAHLGRERRGRGHDLPFHRQLPVRDTPAPDARHAGSQPARGAARAGRGRQRDQSPHPREMLRSWRMQPDAWSHPAPTALAEMLRAARRGHAFPLVLLDGMMPEMDGFMVAEKIREQAELAGATVMMLSSAMPAGAAARCRELGVASYLTKPVSQSDLLDAILQRALRPPADTPVARRPPAIQRAAATARDHGLRILLAEDNVINRAVAAGMLEKRGHCRRHAATAARRWSAVAGRAFDLDPMDVQMPEMDGFEATAPHPRSGADDRPAHADRRHDRPRHERRPRALPGRGDGRLHFQAGAEAALLGLLDKVCGGEHPISTASRRKEKPAAPATSAPTSFSKAKLLETLDGDEEVLQQLVTLFQENTPGLMEEVRDAVARRQPRTWLAPLTPCLVR